VLTWLAIVAGLWSSDGVVTPLAPPPSEPAKAALRSPYLRTTLETALILVGGTVWYLRDADQEKWSRGLEWRSWRRKLFSADDIVFDADHFNTNAAAHPIAGAAYYQIARGNGLGPGAAFISSFLASTFWEYFVEIPEHPSLNDLIMTPVGGSVIGEATYQLGRYLARSGTGPGHCAGSIVFSPVAAVNDWPLCRQQPGPIPFAQLGLAVGVNRAVFDGHVVEDELALAFATEIVTLREYERPGRGSTTVGPGQFSGLFADGRFGEGRLDGIWVNARTVWSGRYDRSYRTNLGDTDIPTLDRSGIAGSGWMLGVGSSFDYRLRDLPRTHDRIASVGIAGPVFEMSARRGVVVRASFTLQYAFAIIGSMAFRAASPSLLDDVIKTPLRDGGYYYAHGAVSAATVSVDLGPVGFSGDARGGAYWSIDAGDPAQSTIQREVLLRDTRLYLSAAMWSRPLVGALRFGLEVEHVRRTSTMLEARVFGTETDVLATTAISF
jgi:hypothetical protein